MKLIPSIISSPPSVYYIYTGDILAAMRICSFPQACQISLKTCIDFGLLLSRIYIIMVSYCILYRVNYISIYTYVILLIIYVLSYTCISVTVSGYLHILHLYFVILCFVLHMYFCDSNCICYLYLRYFIHRLIFILYMYFYDVVCICFMYSMLNIFSIYITFILTLMYSLFIVCLIHVFL